MAVELATAYISLVPSLKGASSKIAQELSSVDADGVGRDIGGKMGGGIVGTMKGLIGPALAVVGSGMFAGFIKDAATASDATDKFKATMNFAGLDTSAITKAKDAAKQYADQTVYDLPTIQNMTAQLASNGIKDYTGLGQAAGNLNAVAGGSSETFKSVAMVMTQTAGAGKLITQNWNQLTNAIPGAAGPLMKAMEDAGAYTGNFRDAMEKGQITSDEFNAALMKLGNQPVAVEAAKSTKTFEGAIGSLQATINSGLMSALDAMKPAITGAISGLSNGLGAIFSGFGAIYNLFKTGDFTGAIGKALGVEEDSKIVDVILTIRDGIIGAFGAIKGAASGINMGAIFATIGPIFAQLGPAIMGILPSIMTLMQSFSPLGIMLKALTPVLPILASAAGQLATVLTNSLASVLSTLAPIIVGIVSGVSSAVTWFMGLHGAGTALAAGITALVAGLGIYKAVMFAISAATKAWAIIQGVLNAVMAINPVTLIIIGIAALIAAIVLLVMNWDTVVNFITNIWGGFVGWLTGVTDGMLGWWGGVWDSFFSNTMGMFSDFTGNTAGMFSDFFGNTIGMFVDFFTNTIGMMSDFFGKLASPIAAGFEIVKVIFSTAWEIIQTYVATVLAILIAVFTGQFDKIPAYLESAWRKISGFFMAGVAAIDHILGGGITAAANFVVGIWNGLVAWVAGIPQRFMAGLSALGNLAGVVGAFIVACKDAVVQIFLDVVAFVASIPQRFLDGLTTLGNLAGTVGAWILSVKEAAVGKFLEMVAWVQGVPSLLLAGLLGIAGLAEQIGIWVLSAKEAAVTKFNELVTWVKGVPGMILSALGNFGSLLSDAGGQIMGGFKKGLEDGFESVKNFVGGIGQWIADHKGPKAYDLALLTPNGGWIMESLETGIKRSVPSLKNLLSDISATIATGVTMRDLVAAPDIPAFGAPSASISGVGRGSGNTFQTTINQVDDPIGTAHAVTRRQLALSS